MPSMPSSQLEAIFSPIMFLFLGFVLSNGSLTPLLYGVYGALLLFYLARNINELARNINEVKAQTVVEGCLARLEEENQKLSDKLEFAEGERTKIIGFNRRLCELFVTMKKERDNVKQQLMDERRENLSNRLYINFLEGELQKLRITHHESSDLQKTNEELTQIVLRSERILVDVYSILADLIGTNQDDNQFFLDFYNPLVEIKERINTYLDSVYQPPDTEDE